jgi:hypothetical protein
VHEDLQRLLEARFVAVVQVHLDML